MKASGKIGSNGVQVSDNVEKLFELDIYIQTEDQRCFILSRLSNKVYILMFVHLFVVSIKLFINAGSKIFLPDIQKPRQMENAARDI